MIPKFTSEDCAFETLPFSLNLEPKLGSQLQGIDKVLSCELVPVNTSIPMPFFRLTWTYEKPDCQTGNIKKLWTSSKKPII